MTGAIHWFNRKVAFFNNYINFTKDFPENQASYVMIEAAEKAGRALIRDFGEVEQLQVSRKGPGDF